MSFHAPFLSLHLMSLKDHTGIESSCDMTEMRIFTMARQVASALVGSNIFFGFVHLCLCVWMCVRANLPWIQHTDHESFAVSTSSRSTCTRSSAFTGMWVLAASWWAQIRQPSCGGWVQPIAGGLSQMHPKLWRTWSWRSGRHLKCWAEELSVRAATCE